MQHDVWDDGLLDENEMVKEMWVRTWEDLGACAPMHMDLKEEEAGA